jgi:hypothetical protein
VVEEISPHLTKQYGSLHQGSLCEKSLLVRAHRRKQHGTPTLYPPGMIADDAWAVFLELGTLGRAAARWFAGATQININLILDAVNFLYRDQKLSEFTS